MQIGVVHFFPNQVASQLGLFQYINHNNLTKIQFVLVTISLLMNWHCSTSLLVLLHLVLLQCTASGGGNHFQIFIIVQRIEMLNHCHTTIGDDNAYKRDMALQFKVRRLEHMIILKHLLGSLNIFLILLRS